MVEHLDYHVVLWYKPHPCTFVFDKVVMAEIWPIVFFYEIVILKFLTIMQIRPIITKAHLKILSWSYFPIFNQTLISSLLEWLLTWP